MAGKRAIRLNTAKDVRKCLGKLINQVNRGDLGLEKGKTMGYLAKILLESLKADALEERVEALEKLLEEQSKGKNN